MSRPFDQAFAKAFAQRPRSATRAVSPVHEKRTATETGDANLVIQIPASASPIVPAPHIEIAQCPNPAEAPKIADNGTSSDAASATPLESHTTWIAPQPAQADWIVATIGMEPPNISDTTHASETLAKKPSPEIVSPERIEASAGASVREENAASDRAEHASPLPTPSESVIDGTVESIGNETTANRTAVEEKPDADEPDAPPALSALDIPLMLEQQMLESLHRAADAMRTADDQLQQSTQSVQAFLPMWEVDRLHWPTPVAELESRLASELSGAAAGIREAVADGMHVLGMTSLHSGAGRTTTLLLLARAVAKAGLRVVVADATNELQTLAEQCGIDSPCGWNEAIVQGKPLEEAATFAIAEGITILAWNPGATDSLTSLPEQAIRSEWQRMRHAVDLVLVELPTIETGVVAALAKHTTLCDALVFVRSASDDDETVRQAIARLQGVSTRPVGIIENDHPSAT